MLKPSVLGLLSTERSAKIRNNVLGWESVLTAPFGRRVALWRTLVEHILRLNFSSWLSNLTPALTRGNRGWIPDFTVALKKNKKNTQLSRSRRSSSARADRVPQGSPVFLRVPQCS